MSKIYISKEEMEEISKLHAPIQAPKTFFEKFVHFWYYYKWWVIGGLVAIFFVIFAFFQQKEAYDYRVSLYSSSYSIGGLDGAANLTAVLESYGDDRDGNGEVKVLLVQNDIASSASDVHETYATAIIYLMLDIDGTTGDMIFITDEKCFDEIIARYGEEAFTSFEGAPLWIPITKDSALGRQLAEAEIPGDLGISLLARGNTITKSKKLSGYYEDALDLLSRIKAANPEMFE